MLAVRKVTEKLFKCLVFSRMIALRPLSTLCSGSAVACRKDGFLVCSSLQLHLITSILCLIKFAFMHVMLGGYDLC